MIMLQAKELMVGDYVINTEFEKNDVDTIEIVEPTRVWLTHGKTYTPIGCIEPIPLTPETLERIGFAVDEDPIYEYYEYYEDEDDYIIEREYTATMECVDDRKCNVKIKYKTYGNEISVFSHDYHNILPLRRLDTQIEYVHELQHIMRLCGIEKEIIL